MSIPIAFQGGWIYASAQDNNFKSLCPATTPVRRIPKEVILKVAEKWYLLGAELGVDHDKLNVIQADYSHCGVDATERMFKEWMNSSATATPAALCSALRAESVGLYNISSKIQEALQTKPDYFSERPHSSADSRSAATVRSEMNQRPPRQRRKPEAGVRRYAPALNLKESELQRELQRKDKELQEAKKTIALLKIRAEALDMKIGQINRESAALKAEVSQPNQKYSLAAGFINDLQTQMRRVNSENAALRAQMNSPSASAFYYSPLPCAAITPVKPKYAPGDEFMKVYINQDLGKTLPTLKNICLIQEEICTSWLAIALVLNLPRAHVDAVMYNKKTAQEQFYTVMETWLQTDTDASYRKLAKTVYDVLNCKNSQQKAIDLGLRIIRGDVHTMAPLN